jgi:tetratricopeptide (TPR) repeat protein
MKNPSLLVFLVGLLYTLIFRGLSVLRREGLSNQFVYEGIGVTSLIAIAMYLGNFFIHPIYFLILLYLITMRVRLLVGLGNHLSTWGRQRDALAVHNLALQLFPDRPTRLIVLINMGAVYLKRQQPDRAIEALEKVKAQISHQLASKYMASCCYNLGMAYRRVGQRDDALRQFREVKEIFPLSQYARLAELAYNATLKNSADQGNQKFETNLS